MKPKKCLLFCLLTFAIALSSLTSRAQELTKKEIKVMNALGLPPSHYDLNDDQAVLNIKEIVRLERSRRGALGIGLGISVAAALPLAGGIALNIENGQWVDDPISYGYLTLGAVTAAISLPFYTGAWSLKKRRNRSIEQLRFLTP